MAKGPKGEKRAADLNRRAFDIVRIASGESADESRVDLDKEPLAVTRGKLGGTKGGKARAAALSPEARRKIAAQAARKRWGKSDS